MMVEIRIMSLKDLEEVFPKAWTGQTSAYKGWTPKAPCYGQCAVTAVVIQDFMGGEILRCPCSSGNTHYWNRLPDGREVDLTGRQFDPDSSSPARGDIPYRHDFELCTKDEILEVKSTYHRYRRLRKRVKKFLREMGYDV